MFAPTRSRSGRQACWALLASVACAACAQVCDEAPPLPPPHPEHDLVIENDVIRYNGKRLEPGMRVKEWIAALGPPDRTGGTWMVWDSIGLGVSTHRLIKVEDELGTMTTECLYTSLEPHRESDPRSPFVGRLSLDGAAFFAGVKLQHVEQTAKLRCAAGDGSFSRSALPNTYTCETERWNYSLEIYNSERTYRVEYLQVCERRVD